MGVSPSVQRESGGTEREREERGDRTETAPAGELPLSQVFEILSNERRRETLRILRDRDGSATLSDVAEIIAAAENDKEVSALTSDERKRTYVGLYQCHLPKMDETGVIRFDKHRGNIRLGPNAPRVFEHMETERARPWARYYLALVGLWGGVLLLGQVGDLAALASPAVVAVQLGTFSLCALLHHRAAGTDGTSPAAAGDPDGASG